MDTDMSNGEEDKEDGVADTDIAPDGDVVLIVGAENVRLRVYSQHLRTASKIFSAMFGSGWSEGQRLSRESTTEVPLPADDADAMRTICCIIHHRNDLVVLEALTQRAILEIAIAADKYDLTIALQHAGSELVMTQLCFDKKMERTGYLLAAAYLFDNTKAFEECFRLLVLDYADSYRVLLNNEIVSRILPSVTFTLLEEWRTQLRMELYSVLLDAETEAVCECGWRKMRRQVLRELLFEISPLELLGTSLSVWLAKVEHVPTEYAGTGEGFGSVRQRCSERSGSSDYYHHRPSEEDTLSWRVKEIKNDAGMSIHGVRRFQKTKKA